MKANLTLNVGCGGRPQDKASDLGDVRIDVERFKTVTMLADAHHLPFKPNTFKQIYCYEVLEHLISPYQALKEMNRVLNDGQIYVTTPNVWYWRRILRCILGSRYKRYKGAETFEDHKQAWDVYEFERLTHQIGLEISRISWLDWYPLRKKRLDAIKPLLNLALPKCIKHTHIGFTLKKRQDKVT